MSDDLPYPSWSSALMAAIRSEDHTVELVPGEQNTVQVAIDGVEMFDGGGGYPPENFYTTGDRDYHRHTTADGMTKLREVAQEDDDA